MFFLAKLRFINFSPYNTFTNLQERSRLYKGFDVDISIEKNKTSDIIMAWLGFKMIRYVILYHMEGQSIASSFQPLGFEPRDLNIGETIERLFEIKDVIRRKKNDILYIDAIVRAVECVSKEAMFLESMEIFSSIKSLARQPNTS